MHGTFRAGRPNGTSAPPATANSIDGSGVRLVELWPRYWGLARTIHRPGPPCRRPRPRGRTRLLNHNYIGTEHILLGLIHEGEGVAAEALESLGISLQAVRSQVGEIIGQGGTSPSAHIPFTPRAKKVLELSFREAGQLGHNYIGTEHILLGLIREGEAGVAAQVLVKLGADLSRVRQQVIQLLSGYSGLGRTVILDALLDLWRGDLTRLESLLGTAARLADQAGDTRQLLALEQMVEIIDAEQGKVWLKPRPPNATPLRHNLPSGLDLTTALPVEPIETPAADHDGVCCTVGCHRGCAARRCRWRDVQRLVPGSPLVTGRLLLWLATAQFAA